MELYQVEELRAGLTVADFMAAYVDPERFLAYCRECPNYQRVWSCPSYDFDPRQLWLSYEALSLYGRKLVFSPQARQTTYGQAGLQELLAASLYQERAGLAREILALEAARPGSLALLPGNCRYCGENQCSRPLGQACRHPQQCRYSIEALGGDVSLIGERLLHSPLLWISQGRLPPYLTLIAGLLQ